MIAQCVSAYAQLRAEARHSSELVSQLSKGEAIRILKEEGPWVWIRTEHGYEGYTRTEQLQVLGEETASFRSLHRLQKTRLGDENPANPILEPEGTLILNSAPSHPGFVNLSTPPPFSTRLLAQQALHLLTVPYVWGGKTVFGLDCSGLVQFLFQKQGYSFPRDAWQQAETGTLVPFDESKPEFEEGDLLFFQHPGKKVHHVAISLGGSRYIHASEWVRINSLDGQDAGFQKDRRDTFQYAKKIQPETLVPLLDSFLQL